MKQEDVVLYRSIDGYYRSVRHDYVDYLNQNKLVFIEDFIEEYRRIMNLCLNELWNKKYYFTVKNQTYYFHLKHREFSNGIPSHFQTSRFNCLKYYNGFLSGRMLSCIVNQLSGILRGELKSSNALNNRFERPCLDNINPMIQPKHVKHIKNTIGTSIFSNYIMLVNFTHKRNENIIIPIKTHKMDDKYNEIGERLNGVLLTRESINYIYEMKGLDEMNKTRINGADMGQKKILTLSDGQMTPKQNSQGKSFDDLEQKIRNKKFNSKSYKRAIKEIKDFSREVLNKLDMCNIQILRLESNDGIKKTTKNAHKHWQTQTIKTKIINMCESNHVDLIHTQPQFKSQRCFICGFVHKSNRKKEYFKCKNCFHVNDADLNSAQNNSLILPYKDLWSYRQYNKSCGFFWNVDGFITAHIVSSDVDK